MSEKELKPEDHYKQKAHDIWTDGSRWTDLSMLIEDLYALASRPAQREVNITEDMAIDLVRELVTAGRNERPLAPIVKRAIDEFKKLNGG